MGLRRLALLAQPNAKTVRDEHLGLQDNGLYRPLSLGNVDRSSSRSVKLTAIPYYAWGNRVLKSMRVWVP
jgi:DUF1680 family protein